STVVTIDEVEFKIPEDLREQKRVQHNLGDLILSDADVAGLDRFLQRIRAKSENHSTTVERILLTQRRDGAIIAIEEFNPTAFAEFQKNEVHIADLLVRLKFPSIKSEPK